MVAAQQTRRQSVACGSTCRATDNVPPAVSDPGRSSGAPAGRQRQLMPRRMRRRASGDSTVLSRHPNRIRRPSRLLNADRERTICLSSSSQDSGHWTFVNQPLAVSGSRLTAGGTWARAVARYEVRGCAGLPRHVVAGDEPDATFPGLGMGRLHQLAQCVEDNTLHN